MLPRRIRRVGPRCSPAAERRKVLIRDVVRREKRLERLARELRVSTRLGETTDVSYLLDAVRFEKGQKLFGRV